LPSFCPLKETISALSTDFDGIEILVWRESLTKGRDYYAERAD
jgi:hypothetical protein